MKYFFVLLLLGTGGDYLYWLKDIYGLLFIRHCGTRTAGESLFSAAKKVTKKAATTAAPRKRHGVPI